MKYRSITSPAGMVSVLAAAAMAAAAGCSSASSGEQSPAGGGGTLRVATEQTPVQFDPCGASNGSEEPYLTSIYAPLIKQDPKTGELKPGIATSWEFSGANKLTFTMELREGLSFQDDTAVNAESVAKSLRQCLEMEQQLPDSVEDIQATGSGAIEFSLSEPAAALPHLLADRAGFIASPSAREELGQEFASQPVGSGPYRLTEYVAGHSAVLTRWDGYEPAGEPAAKVDRIEMQIIEDASAMTSAITSGEVDYAYGFGVNTVPQIQDIPGLTVSPNTRGAGFASISMNKSRSPLDDPQVRRAISHAIDRVGMAEAVSSGVWNTPAWGPYPPDSPYYSAFMEDAQPYDPDEAKRLLAEAGYPDGFELQAVALSSKPYKDNAVIIKDQLAKVGIRLDLQIKSTADATKSYYPGTDVDMLISAMGGAGPHYVYPRYYSADSPVTPGDVKLPGFQEPLAALDEAYTREDTLAAVEELNRLIADQAPVTGLYFLVEYSAWTDEVTGAENVPTLFGNNNLNYLGLSR